MLKQKCTRIYKIAAMDREIRKILFDVHGVSMKTRRPGRNIVEKWIGFDADEVARIQPSSQKYVYFRYPLIELCVTHTMLLRFFAEYKVPEPPRSVCNACFANGVQTFKLMFYERPADWAQAVAVDDAVRDLSCIGVKDEVFVSNTLLPLRELARRNFVVDDDGDEDGSCDSGHCFI